MVLSSSATELWWSDTVDRVEDMEAVVVGAAVVVVVVEVLVTSVVDGSWAFTCVCSCTGRMVVGTLSASVDGDDEAIGSTLRSVEPSCAAGSLSAGIVVTSTASGTASTTSLTMSPTAGASGSSCSTCTGCGVVSTASAGCSELTATGETASEAVLIGAAVEEEVVVC